MLQESASGGEWWNAFGWCYDSYLRSESGVRGEDDTTRYNWQKRNTGRAVICPTSVASKGLSRVDGWRVDAEGKAHQCSLTEQLMDGILFKAVPPTSSQVFISHLSGGFSQMITSFTCKEKLQIETLADFRQQGLRWRCRVFVYLPPLCFYCHCNQAWGLHWELILGHTFYLEIDKDVESHPAKNVIYLFCSGICLADGSGDTGDSHQGHREVSRAVMREAWAVIAC